MGALRFTKTTVLALCPDNTTGQISPQDLRDVFASMRGGFAHAYTSAGVTALAVDATPVEITTLEHTGPTNGLVLASNNSVVTVDLVGVYLVDFSCYFTGDVSDTFVFEIAVNGTLSGRKSSVTTTAVVDTITESSCNALLELSALDTVSIFASSTSGGISITIKDATFTIKKVA